VAFLFASNYSFGPVREQFFHLVGPAGLEQYFAGLVGVYGDWIVPKGNRLVKKELNAQSGDGLSLRGVDIRSAPSAHVSPSLSYRIEAEGLSVTVSGDTDFSEHLVDLAQGADLLITECAMPEGSKVPGHLVPSEAGRIASVARVEKLVLTHLYPPCDEVDIVAQAAEQFDGPIVKARDLMVIEV
jgi:ribonuclease BN (tRNA processing enzyme)